MIATERLTAQLLAGSPARSPVEVVDRLMAVQAQDPRGARLTIRVRSSGLHAADVDQALTADRSLVITWLNRGTLHLVRSEDYWWLHALMTPPLWTANARRLAQEGVSSDAADRAVGVIEHALTDAGPLTRAQLRARIGAAGVRVEGQALVHLLVLATLRGIVVRGPMTNGHHAFVLVRDWLVAPTRPVDRDLALSELARRYLRGHGPAADRDLAKWTGLGLRDVRRGLQLIASELTHRPDGLVDLTDRPGSEPLPGPRLLGAFDPLLLGWASRQLFVGPHQSIVTSNGLFRPFALVDGRAAATWTFVRGRVDLDPFAEFTADVSAALAIEAADVERFLTYR